MLGELIRTWREQQGISVRKLAANLGINYATLSRLERGRPGDQATLAKILQWLLHKAKP